MPTDRAPRSHSWLRHCATSRKVAGLISDDTSGIFHWHNFSGRSKARGSTQNLVSGKGAQDWQPYHLQVPIVWEPQIPGTLRTCTGIALPLLLQSGLGLAGSKTQVTERITDCGSGKGKYLWRSIWQDEPFTGILRTVRERRVLLCRCGDSRAITWWNVQYYRRQS